MLQHEATHRWSLVTIFPKPWAVALELPRIGGHLVRCEQLVQRVPWTGVVVGCETNTGPRGAYTDDRPASRPRTSSALSHHPTVVQRLPPAPSHSRPQLT